MERHPRIGWLLLALAGAQAYGDGRWRGDVRTGARGGRLHAEEGGRSDAKSGASGGMSDTDDKYGVSHDGSAGTGGSRHAERER